MSILTIVLSAAFFLVLGVAYSLGWSYIKRAMPEYLVHYYLLSSAIRFILVAIIVLAYIFLSGATRSETIHFVIMFMVMYVVMMVVTLALRHK